MNRHHLWSLRLGFTGRQAPAIKEMGLERFLKTSFSAPFSSEIPEFLGDVPKTLAEFKQYRQEIKTAPTEEKKKALRKKIRGIQNLQEWWLKRMNEAEFPLRQKMLLFWQNHFVVTAQKVKASYFIYQYHKILEEHAFGNLKTLTKKVLKSNAMVLYLDNRNNKKGNINENLSRELLELFTLGIGNYAEEDIKNGAKALAGLGPANGGAVYRAKFEVDETINYLGRKGHFKADDLVDIIFEQKAAPYLITKKILQWFLYDEPADDLVNGYASYFRKKNFEIKPLLLKIFMTEYQKESAGSKIKDPLLFAFQTLDELNRTDVTPKHVNRFLRNQGMVLYGQPNVKGWAGGTSWLTSHTFLQRHRIIDKLTSGNPVEKSNAKKVVAMNTDSKARVEVSPNAKNNLQVIEEMKDRLLFSVDSTAQEDMERILKYDFDPNQENAQRAILQLFGYMAKLPEYQLI